MSKVVKVLPAFAAVAVGAATLGAAAPLSVAAFASYATIAGGVLTGIGAVTGAGDLSKIGLALSLAGGITSAVTGSVQAASGGLGEVVDATGGLETAVGSTANTGISGAVDAIGGLETALESPANSLASRAAATAGSVPGVTQVADPTTALAGRAAANVAPAGVPPIQSTAATVPQSVAEGARGFTQNDLTSFMEKLTNAGKGVGEFLNRNPVLTKAGLGALSSIYGPEAEQIDYQRSLANRARERLNNPIKLGRITP